MPIRIVQILSQLSMHVNACRDSTFRQCLQQGHLHVPGDKTPPVKLPGEDPAYSGLRNHVHTAVYSIRSAIVVACKRSHFPLSI